MMRIAVIFRQSLLGSYSSSYPTISKLSTINTFSSVASSIPYQPNGNDPTNSSKTSASHGKASSTAQILQQSILTRRSVNQFLPTLPGDWREKLARALEAARHAPNHKRTEPWRFYVFGPKSTDALLDVVMDVAMRKSERAPSLLSHMDRWRQVPQFLAVTAARTRDDPVREQEDFAATCCAIQNMMLVLHSEGIGTKWVTGDVIKHPSLMSLLRADANKERLVGLFWVGIPAVVPKSPFKQKSVNDMTVQLY